MSWECTYRNGYGFETIKTCYDGCCEEDCCVSSTTVHTGIVVGVSVPTLFVILFLVVCCRLWRRRQMLASSNTAVVTVPTRSIIVTNTTVTRAGAPVPQHHGYDQPGYQPSTMPSPAQFQPPPPYSEQVPKAEVV